MGRTLKRVPMDFKWKLHQVWKGYINPYRHQECKACGGRGLNEATEKIARDWYSFDNEDRRYLPNGRSWNNAAWSHHITDDEVAALVAEGRLMDFTHTWIPNEGWVEKNPKYIPTAEEVNKWSQDGMGHDSINQWICVKARATRLGVYGLCEYCNGEGHIWQSEEIKKLHEEWKSFDPPKGDGYQLWETTSEGSPISPVFETLDTLCEWCADNASTFASYKATKQEWLQMLQDDFVSHKEGSLVFI